MRLPKSLEVRGLAIEIAGLVMLVVAAIWQASVTDWFDTFPAKSQYFIQETANLAVLRAQDSTALALAEEDAAKRKQRLYEVSDLTRKATGDLVKTRMQVETVEKSQGALLKLVRHALFVFGALLIVVGKFCVLRHKASLQE